MINRQSVDVSRCIGNLATFGGKIMNHGVQIHTNTRVHLIYSNGDSFEIFDQLNNRNVFAW